MFAVAAGDDVRDVGGLPVAGAHLQRGAGHVPHHVVQKAAALDGEDDHGSAAVNIAVEDGATVLSRWSKWPLNDSKSCWPTNARQASRMREMSMGR